MQTPDCQDWTTVTIHNKNHFCSSNKGKQNNPGNKEFQALNDNNIPKLEKITSMQSAALRDARNARKISQSVLAQMLNVNVKIIQEYENGTVSKFNKTFYNKLLRRLNISIL